MKLNVMSDVVVVAPVPFVTTIAIVPEPGVTLLMLSAAPVVAPLIESITCVEDDVIALFVMVNVKSAAAAILTVVNMTCPALLFNTTGPDAAPEAVLALNCRPFPAVELTKLPFVAVMLPNVAVTVVAAETDPNVETKLPVEAVILPVVAVIPVPPVSVVVVPKAPVIAVFPVALPIATIPVPPVPIVVVAAPEVLSVVAPRELNVVACTGLGVVLPKPKTGGEAKSKATDDDSVAGEM
jgi:hypothetical protein